MNDVYVGLFIVAAYTLFAALWTGAAARAGAFWVAMPVIGVLLGLALASKWVGPTRSAALGILILARERARPAAPHPRADRQTTRARLHGASASAEGQRRQPDVPAHHDRADDRRRSSSTCCTRSPGPWRRSGSPSRAPAAVGHPARPRRARVGKLATPAWRSAPLKVTPLRGVRRGRSASIAVSATFSARRAPRFGPLAPPPAPDDPAALLGPGAGRRRLAAPRVAALGVPAVWAGVCLVVIPLGGLRHLATCRGRLENHQLVDGWPPGHTGQTLLDLTQQMYDYHNNLRAPHPASSPWWAWPLDLKPVWFYQGGFAAARGVDLRRRQPRHLVARHPGHGLRAHGRRSSGAAWRWR